MTHSTVAFGTFEFDLSTGELRSKGTRVALQDQPAQLLGLLVRQAGRVVTREELRKALWSDDTFVEFDTALNVAVNKVRQALRDSATSPRFVETVPRRGYRFLADVRPVEVDVRPTPAAGVPVAVPPPDAAPVAGAPRNSRARIVAGAVATLAVAGVFLLPSSLPWRRATSGPRSVAVLPFRPLVADARDEALEVGMAEAVIVKLGQLQGLRVPSIGAVQRYAGRERDPLRAGGELGVDSVLDGSLQRSNGRLRVSARLLDVRSGTPRWARQWDLPWTDVFTVQDAMATDVARELALTFSSPRGPQHTTDPDAYERYLRARYLVAQRTPETSRRAGELLEEVVRIDPGFAPAYAVMADAYLVDPLAGRAARAVPLHGPTGRATGRRAGPDLRGGARACWAPFWRSSTGTSRPVSGSCERALELGPEVPTVLRLYSLFLWFEGRFDEALTLNDRELALDPASVFANRNRAIIYLLRPPVRGLHRAVTQDARARPPLHRLRTHGWAGRSSGSAATPRPWRRSSSRSRSGRIARTTWRRCERRPPRAGTRGFWRRWLEIEERQPEYFNTDGPAMAWLRIGERERALSELERLCEARSPWMRAIGVEPLWDPLRADPRFQALMRKARFRGQS